MEAKNLTGEQYTLKKSNQQQSVSDATGRSYSEEFFRNLILKLLTKEEDRI